MPLLEEALFDYLPSVPDLGALIDDRIYPLRLPEGCDLPAVAWQRISAQRTYTHDAFEDTAAWVQCRVQFDCWGQTAEDAIAVGEAVVAALSGYEGTMGTASLGAVTVEFELDDYEPDTKLYRRLVDVFVTYEEARTAS